MPEVTRRRFLTASALAVVAAADATSITAGEGKSSPSGRDWSSVRGFNYQPSYGSSGIELWQRFDAGVIDRELGLGKKFPGMNAIRLWLSWDSFLRNPKRFAGNFDQALDIAQKYGLVVMPVLFNRWHDAVLDYGGIYIDHFLPKVSWVQKRKMFDPYLEAIVGGHRDDPRILAWDLCNEPYSYSCPREDIPQIVQAGDVVAPMPLRQVQGIGGQVADHGGHRPGRTFGDGRQAGRRAEHPPLLGSQ